MFDHFVGLVLKGLNQQFKLLSKETLIIDLWQGSKYT